MSSAVKSDNDRANVVVHGPELDIIEQWEAGIESLSNYLRGCTDMKRLGRMALSGKSGIWLLRWSSYQLGWMRTTLTAVAWPIGLSNIDVNGFYAISYSLGGDVANKLIVEIIGGGYAHLVQWRGYIEVVYVFSTFAEMLLYFELDEKNNLANYKD